MDCDGLLGGLFADCQEWHFQAANPSDKGRTILLLGRFAEAQECGFRVRNVENGQCSPAMSFLLILRNRVFRMLNLQK